MSSGRRDANRGAAKYLSASKQRKRALLLGDLDRRLVRGVAHSRGDARRRSGAPVVGVVAQSEHDQRVAQAGKAQADATLRLRFPLLLRQRPYRRVEHVVEHAHGDRHDAREGARSRSGRRA